MAARLKRKLGKQLINATLMCYCEPKSPDLMQRDVTPFVVLFSSVPRLCPDFSAHKPEWQLFFAAWAHACFNDALVVFKDMLE